MITVGFVVYAFEGIGVVMPIMQTCANPEIFTKILLAAIITLTIIYNAFGNLCYITYGNQMNQPLITEMLPADDNIVIITKLLFIGNLLCSYALCIYPTNTIIEGWIWNKDDKSDRTYFKKNISRALVALAAVILGVALASKIDKFLGLMGAVLCAPLAITFPALVHYKLLARTRTTKIVDITLVIISVFVFTFSTAQSISSW